MYKIYSFFLILISFVSCSSSEDKQHYESGLAKIDSGKYEEAINEFNQAISSNPEYSEAFLSRGIAKKIIGKTDEALSDYIKR
jgi:Flp pilus assembly protein TadD